MLLTLVFAYLAVTIAIGQWAARRVSNTADFAIAGLADRRGAHHAAVGAGAV